MQAESWFRHCCFAQINAQKSSAADTQWCTHTPELMIQKTQAAHDAEFAATSMGHQDKATFNDSSGLLESNQPPCEEIQD